MSLENKNVSLEEMFATIDSIYAAHPEAVPVTNVQFSETVTSMPQQAEIPFNIAKVIQECMGELRPTTVLIKYEVKSLSAEEIQLLKPVRNHTIAELLILACGKGTQASMLNGALYAHTACNQYVKIVPEIDKKEGYASYKFTAVNWKVLNRLIEKYCELLNNTDRFEGILGYHRDAGEKYFGIEPEYDYGTNEDTKEDTDINDVDSIFGANTSVSAISKAKSKIIDAADDDPDACTLSTLNDMLKARMQSSRKYLSLNSLSERLAAQERNYDEDMELLKYLKIVTKQVYKELERPWHIPSTKYFDTFRISGHYLSAWFYFPADYNSKINNPPLDAQGSAIKYQVDHIKRGIEYRSDNRPENLRIVLKSYNSGRTSRSVEVDYNGDNYVSLASYCKATGAGNATNIQNIKSSTKQGETFDYNRRTYLKVDENHLIATDKEVKEVKAPEITFNGVVYPTLTAFAKARKLSPDAVRVAVNRAKEKGETKFSCKFKNKRYNFYLDNDDMTITI